MKLLKLKTKELKLVKYNMLAEQCFECLICGQNMSKFEPRNICLDHNHHTGRVRGVLCRACNQLEGKVTRLYVRLGLKNRGVKYNELLRGLIRYSKQKDTRWVHPTFKGKV